MRKQYFLSLCIGMALVLLAGCGVNENLTSASSNEKANYNGTLSIGDSIINSFNTYSYDGIVGGSVVVSVNETRILYIPVETTEWITLPYLEGKVKIKIGNVDKAKGTIDIELIQK